MVCTDVELINRVCKGDIDAFSEIISKYANAVYGVAYGKLGDFHTAQDIAQEVFVKTFRKLSNIKEPEKLGSWLYAVTTRECIDWFRSNRNEAVYDLLETVDIPQLETTEDKLLRNELRNEVWNALTPYQRSIVQSQFFTTSMIIRLGKSVISLEYQSMQLRADSADQEHY